jgi:hypothetical protein
VIAVIVAPVLSVLAWFAVGQWGLEQPRPAQAGSSYPLQEQSNCRYASGKCDLQNADLNVSLRYNDRGGTPYLELHSSHRLSGVVMSIGLPEAQSLPQRMAPVGTGEQKWTLPVLVRPAPGSRIRLVASSAGATYFGEANTAFLQTEE